MIESINNEKIKELKKLFDKKYIFQEKKFLVETEHLASEAIKNGYASQLVCTNNYINKTNIPTLLVSDKVMKYLSNLVSPSSVIAVCNLLKEDKVNIGSRVVILDKVQDPGNLGTIIRSCVAFKVDTLVLLENTISVYNDKVIRSSEGNLFNLNIIKMNFTEIYDYCKTNSISLVSSSLGESVGLKEFTFPNKFALILGSEGSGISTNILDKSDEIVKIEMVEKCESLNVSVACGILLYESYKDLL